MEDGSSLWESAPKVLASLGFNSYCEDHSDACRSTNPGRQDGISGAGGKGRSLCSLTALTSSAVICGDTIFTGLCGQWLVRANRAYTAEGY
jgi:hypothetical protein